MRYLLIIDFTADFNDHIKSGQSRDVTILKSWTQGALSERLLKILRSSQKYYDN